jgi:hypothetical protein
VQHDYKNLPQKNWDYAGVVAAATDGKVLPWLGERLLGLEQWQCIATKIILKF